jgi:hypothetical protein
MFSMLGVLFIARPAFIWGTPTDQVIDPSTRALAIIISLVGAVFAGAAYVTVRYITFYT